VKLWWLDEAVADLVAIRDYVTNDSPDAAQEVAARIIAAAQLLADYPAAGRPGRVPNTRELSITGTPYFIPYAVRSDRIEILRVLHGARRWPERT
jgi:toxin ParE1/3/4